MSSSPTAGTSSLSISSALAALAHYAADPLAPQSRGAPRVPFGRAIARPSSRPSVDESFGGVEAGQRIPKPPVDVVSHKKERHDESTTADVGASAAERIAA